ncbi:hypothetical protein DMP07_07440 [Slackia faecicanis]|uniref:DUF1836 domain-containing protein n=1 Tax=Slackia faecicanis TaxID=255723 RepID=A0A3N0ADV6_9ACTN|nr:DUF1836 domain-containing protein [Slackia faecicanis]RNL19168.1 hypothetical protein DMP07_07440 [Slackia faecicanis]
MEPLNNTEETPTASERAMRDFEALVQTLHFPRYRELPAIELYMDQVLTYVDDQLRPLLPEGEKLLTSSMVNNYVKQKLIPVPTQKRYGREHVALLIFICLMKRSVSIADIQRLFAMQAAASSTERAYDFFCTAAEESLRSLFCGTTSARNLSEWAIEDPSGFAFSLRIAQADELSLERKMVIAAATAIANKVYLEKCLEFASL